MSLRARDEVAALAGTLRLHAAHARRLGIVRLPKAISPQPDLPAMPTVGTADRPSVAQAGQASRLQAVERQVIACTRCPLSRTRTRHVFGDGNPGARLVFVGEAPGREEDLQGKPFVGAAGQLLTKMIAAMGLRREEVYICNVLKDRPPNNRIPQPDEIEACRSFLLEQLAIIRPAVICTLGSIAAKTLLGPAVSITKVRGQRHEFQGTAVIPTFHPAYLLRNPDAKRLVWQDLKTVKRLLEQQG